MPKSKPMVLQLLSATLLIKRRRSFLNARWLLASIFLTTVLPLLGLCGFSLWPARAEAEQIWRPQPGTSWQWQLTVDEGERVDTSLDVDAYDIDGFDNDKAVVDDIHRKGAKAICYISVGSWEKWRPDAGRFPDRVKGKRMG